MEKEQRYGIKNIVFLRMMAIIVFIIFGCCGNVTTIQAKSIRLNYSWINMTEGYSIRLKISGTRKKAKWSSSNRKVAVVSKKGKVSGKKAGRTTITAKIGRKRLKCRVKVRKIPKRKIVVKDYTDTTFNVSELKINIYDTSCDNDGYAKLSKERSESFNLELLNNSESIIWTSNNESVATVRSGKVTAQSKGNCTITATAGGKQYNCPVTVTDYDDVETVYNQKSIYIMLSLINKDRVKAKTAPLMLKSEITKIADVRVVEASKVFSHSRPDGSSYKTAYNSTGFRVGSAIGENLAYNLDSARNRKNLVYDAYKNLFESEGHRRNILSKDFKYIGIGSYTKEYPNDWGYACVETYFAQEFYTQ